MAEPQAPRPPDPRPAYVVSGGAGASGEQLVRTALAQFEGAEVPLVVVAGVSGPAQLEKVVAEAQATGGTIVHTLVDARLRQVLTQLAQERHLVAVDLMGPLLSRLTEVVGREPSGKPGRYRQLREEYFDRVEAIEFAVAHDDGRNLADLSRAEIVLVGVSRVGKTPLSMYLAILGWKAANVPLVSEVPPPPVLFELDPRRVVGLTIDPEQLQLHRRQRTGRLGMKEQGDYVDGDALRTEVRSAVQLCRRSRFSLVEVTDKPIEESANEVVAVVTHRLGSEVPKTATP